MNSTFIISTSVVLSFLTCVLPSQASTCSKCHEDWKVLRSSHPTVSTTNFEDCQSCHVASAKPISFNIHLAHIDRLDCRSCHQIKKGSLYLSDGKKPIGQLDEETFDLYKDFYSNVGKVKSSSQIHLRVGMNCGTCHGNSLPEIGSSVDNSKCESCHGTQMQIAEKTASAVNEQNPHQNHQGVLPCSKCHSGHENAKSYCLECHNSFKQIMPENRK